MKIRIEKQIMRYGDKFNIAVELEEPESDTFTIADGPSQHDVLANKAFDHLARLESSGSFKV